MNDSKRPIIVVADDDRDIRELIKMQLTRHGFDVYVADNGETALELIVEHQPALALLDIMMPKMSGMEVARRIREDPAIAAVGIMMISARSSGRLEPGIHGLDALDIADYITKPFSLHDLVQRVNDVINKPRTEGSTQT